MRALDLRLVNRSVLAQRYLPVHDEEAEFAVLQLSHRVELDDLRVRSGLLLLCSDHDAASFSHTKVRVNQVAGDHLVTCRHNLMQLEFVHTDVVMLAQISRLL